MDVSGLIFSLFIAGCLLFLLALWLKRKPAAPAQRQNPQDASQLLANLRMDLPPRAVMERILDPTDLKLVSEQSDRKIRQLFLEERRRLAILWLVHTRQALGRLVRFHRLLVRSDAGLHPTSELRLSVEYVSFIACYWALIALVAVRGPYGTRRAIGVVTGVAADLWESSERILGTVNLDRLQRVKISASDGSGTI